MKIKVVEQQHEVKELFYKIISLLLLLGSLFFNWSFLCYSCLESTRQTW